MLLTGVVALCNHFIKACLGNHTLGITLGEIQHSSRQCVSHAVQFHQFFFFHGLFLPFTFVARFSPVFAVFRFAAEMPKRRSGAGREF